jgi:hypothetical protein
MRHIAGIVIAIVIIWIMGIAGQSDFARENPSLSPRVWHVQTDCPHEDSCYVDYRNGEWYIIEGERP